MPGPVMAVLGDSHHHASCRRPPHHHPQPPQQQQHNQQQLPTQTQTQQLLMGCTSVAMDGSVQRLFQSGLALPASFKNPYPNIPIDSPPANKRRRADRHSQTLQLQQQQQSAAHLLHLGVDLNQSLGIAANLQAPPQNNVSTGLRLALDDERSSVTSSRPDSATPSAVSVFFRDELSAQLVRHQEELNQLLCAQAEQLRAAVEEAARRQTRDVLWRVESDVWKRMRDKEAEVEAAARRNAELEEKVRQVSLESHMWQTKARNQEAMVAILRSNLQAQQSKMVVVVEGCGESSARAGVEDDDDAASAFVDPNAVHHHHHHEQGSGGGNESGGVAAGFFALPPPLPPSARRCCKICNSREASVVLLPCLHLCVCVGCCKEQQQKTERCPVCGTRKTALVEVYLA